MTIRGISHIKRLIADGEHQQQDFKFEISDSRKIAKTFVAFANTDGGTLLIGVKDNGNIAGVRSDEEYYMVDAAANMYCKPPVPFEARKWDVEGKTVLEVIIPKSLAAPHYAEVKPKEWLVYIRVQDENILANNIHLKVWKRIRQEKGIFMEFTDKEKLLLHFLEQNPSITLTKFCKVGLISRHEAENILANLIALGLVESCFNDQHFFYKRTGEHKMAPEPSRLSGRM